MVNTGDKLYFAPNLKFADVNLDDRDCLLEAFRKRVEGYYLAPARVLKEDGNAFATGVICSSAIDFIARTRGMNIGVSPRFVDWMKDFMDIGVSSARRFYLDFRCGLVHEGRVKRLGQFSYDCEKMISVEDGVVIVNPDKLYESLEIAFSNYMDHLVSDDDAFAKFHRTLTCDFGDEIDKARELS